MPRPLRVEMLDRCVVINGIQFYVYPNGNKDTPYCHDGIRYDTEEEFWVAEMLSLMDIRFLHHVNFVFPRNGGERMDIWRPDFVFDRPYCWEGSLSRGSVIVGLEVKRSHIKAKTGSRSRRLYAHYGFLILPVARREIAPCYRNGKVLPLRPLA